MYVCMYSFVPCAGTEIYLNYFSYKVMIFFKNFNYIFYILGLPLNFDYRDIVRGKLFQLPMEAILKNSLTLDHFLNYMASIDCQHYVNLYLNIECELVLKFFKL